MPPSPPQSSYRQYGGIAYAFVVGVCYLGYFSDQHVARPGWALMLNPVLGGTYLGVGLFGRHVLHHATTRTRILYFLALCGLLTGMEFTSPIHGLYEIIVLPAVSSAILNLPRRGAALVAVYLFVLTIGVWLHLSGWSSAWHAALTYSTAFVFIIVFTLISRQALLEREKAEQLSGELAAANRRLRDQSAQVEELATVRERNRLAREIHDGVGHYLTVIKTQLDAAEALLPARPEPAREVVAKAARLSAEALADVRRSVGSLRTDAPHLPLGDAVRTLAGQGATPTEVRILGTPRALAAATEHALYRATQEALTNIRKHARATAAAIELDFQETDRVRLAVTDNGRGVPGQPDPIPGFGLQGLRERVELLGGSLTTASPDAGGFTLTVELPA